MLTSISSVVRPRGIHDLVTGWGVPVQVGESALDEVASDLGLDIDDLAARVVAYVVLEQVAAAHQAPGLSLVRDAADLQAPRYKLASPRYRPSGAGWTATRLRRVDAPTPSGVADAETWSRT